jgi:hypothetical protein
MGHSDWLTADLAKFESQLDADQAFDDAVDCAQALIETDFRVRLSRLDADSASVLGDALAGLTGNGADLLYADLATGGQALQSFFREVIYTHTLIQAQDEVRGRK